MSSSSASDTSDSDIESSDAEEELLKSLEKQLEHNPFDYDTHLKHIALARNSGEFTLLHNARERMAATFPLSQGTSLGRKKTYSDRTLAAVDS